MCQFRPIHLSICQLWQLQTSSVHLSDNSVWTPSIFSFFGQTFRTLTCVCPSPMDNILSDWAQSPFIPTTTHLLAFVPFLVHPPIHLPTLATPDSVHCRRDNGPISEPPTETKLTARACH